MNGLTAVFDVAGSPAWLKAVVLKFALVARLLPGALPAAANALPPVRLPDPASRVPTGSAASASGAPSLVAALPPASPHELPPAVKPPMVSAVRQASSEVDEGRSSDASSRKLGQRRPGSGLTRPPLPQQPDTRHTSAGRQATHVGGIRGTGSGASCEPRRPRPPLLPAAHQSSKQPLLVGTHCTHLSAPRALRAGSKRPPVQGPLRVRSSFRARVISQQHARFPAGCASDTDRADCRKHSGHTQHTLKGAG